MPFNFPAWRPTAAAISLALAAASAPAFVPIFDIQGHGNTSPMEGETVVTRGVVTRVAGNGFFLQDREGDADPATSDGIFVFTGSAQRAAAVVGNLVQVAGSVIEFNAATDAASRPLTEIGRLTELTVLGTGYRLAPTPLRLPLAAGDSLERFEGMLVRLDGPLTVQQNQYQARHGQLTLGAGGRHETPTNRHRPGTAQAAALSDLQARSRLLLDDGSARQNLDPTSYAQADGVPRVGDQVLDLIGVLDQGPATPGASGPATYRLLPTVAPSWRVANPRTPAPAAVGGDVRLASMNVQNFFTTFTDGTNAERATGQGCTQGKSLRAEPTLCRGANNLAEFERQRTKIVLALAGINADAVGLVEVQNNGNLAVQNLVDALNARVGSGTYATVTIPAQGTGSDAIRVALLYKPARLSPVGSPVTDANPVHVRPPLAQAFATASGARVMLVVNHWKSKRRCPAPHSPQAAGNVDSGDGQGCWNGLRRQQARRLHAFVSELQTANRIDDVLLLGDLNAYAKEDPVHELLGRGYVDEPGRFDASGHSYVYDGTSGRLDHALSTRSLSAKVTGATLWHIDADEAPNQDYNREFRQPACASCAPDAFDGTTPYRASDHDPVVVGVNLGGG